MTVEAELRREIVRLCKGSHLSINQITKVLASVTSIIMDATIEAFDDPDELRDSKPLEERENK